VDSEDQHSFNVFSAPEHVTISGIADEAEIVSSPKTQEGKITFTSRFFDQVSDQLYYLINIITLSISKTFEKKYLSSVESYTSYDCTFG
jgi:hypothetical protein